MDAELKQTLIEMEQRITERFDHRLEATETKLLTGFHDWARSYEVRARGTSTAVRDFDERLGIIEERLSRLERKRNGGAAR